MYNPFVPFIQTLLGLIESYEVVIVVAVVMSWLVLFGVVNPRNRYGRPILQVLDALTEPVFRQVRKVVPPISGLDLSPLIVLVFLQFVSYSISYYML